MMDEVLGAVGAVALWIARTMFELMIEVAIMLGLEALFLGGGRRKTAEAAKDDSSGEGGDPRR